MRVLAPGERVILAWLPMPFRRRLRIELTNGSPRPLPLYYQLGFTLGPEPDDAGLLHARRGAAGLRLVLPLARAGPDRLRARAARDAAADGAVPLPRERRELEQRFEREGRVAGTGWMQLGAPGAEWLALCERQDDVCATAYLYLREPQAVPRLDRAAACADLARRSWEAPSPFELALAGLTGAGIGATAPGS